MWSTQPGAVESYFAKVARDFEQFAERTYPPALADPKAPDHRVLAGLRYVETRRVSGHESVLRELLLLKRRGKLADDINAACLDALIATCDDKEGLAELLAEVGSRPRPLPASKLCADGLQRLGPVGCEVLLRRLAVSDNGLSRRKLARMLSQASGTVMPEPLRFWKDAEPADLQAAVEDWRATLIDIGRIPAPPAEPVAPPQTTSPESERQETEEGHAGRQERPQD